MIRHRRPAWRVADEPPARLVRAISLAQAVAIVACAISVGVCILDAIEADAWTPLRAALAVLP